MVYSTDSARSRKAHKPQKPDKDFPLFPHANGQWARKVKGKIRFFGVWANPQAALELWITEKDDWLAGRDPRVSRHPHGITVADLGYKFCQAKERKVTAGELSPLTMKEYKNTAKRLILAFGEKTPVSSLATGDFEKLRASIAEQWGPIRLGNEINRVRSIFKYGVENNLIPKAISFGSEFKRPSRKIIRRLAAQTRDGKLFSASEIKGLLKIANVQLRAMILLGLNAAFGNEDLARLPFSAIDLKTGWTTYPRPKTGADRKAKLWPETVKAIKSYLGERAEPKDPANAEFVFLTVNGNSWAASDYGTTLTHEMDKLLDKLKIKRPGLGFYSLRRSFRTVADECRDDSAVRLVMGHAHTDGDMSQYYVLKIENERLEAVAEHVHAWLFTKPKKCGEK